MVTSSDFSPQLKSLLEDRIHTEDELATLLLLRSDRRRTWKVDDVAVELRGRYECAVSALEGLITRRLVTFAFEQDEAAASRARRYAYAPQPLELEAAIEELENVYAEARIEIIMLMASNSLARVRARALDAFSRTAQPKQEPNETDD